MKKSCKTLLLLITLFVFNQKSYAQQDSSTSKNKLWIGVNTADLLLKDPILLPSLSAIWNITERGNLRLEIGYDGINGNSSVDVKSTQDFSNFSVDTVAHHLPFSDWVANVGLAYYQTKVLSPKCDMYYGVEAMWRWGKSFYRIDYEITQEFGGGNTQFIDIKEKSFKSMQGYAISPLAGVQWKLGKAIRVGFETKSLFLVQNTTEEVFFNSIQSSSFNPQLFVQNTHHLESNRSSITRLLPMAGLYLMVQL